MNILEQVKQALQDVVAPEIKALQVEIRRLDDKIDSRFDSLDDKVDSLRREMVSEIKRVEIEIKSIDDKIDIAMQIRERLAALEAKVG